MSGASRGDRARTDHTLINAILVLLVVGIVAVYDSSYVQIARTGGDGLLYLKKQAVFVLVGMGALLFGMKFKYWRLKKLAVPLLALALALLCAVWVPGIGVLVNGARRWIAIGPIQFQPSELAKLSLVIYLSALLARNLEGRGFNIRSFGDGLLAPLLVVGLFVLLVEREPDLGTAFVMGLTSMAIFYLAGAQKRHLAAVMMAGVVFVAFVTMLHGFRGDRITAWLNPNLFKDTLNYQPIHGMRAVGSGELTGMGIGAGREKFYLPEANTDYIFATVAEETGLLGSLLVIAMLMVVARRASIIARDTTDAFGSLLAGGIGAMISLQAIVNIAVVTRSMPATGVPLPFISYGGTALLFTMAGIGILLNIARYPEGMGLSHAIVNDPKRRGRGAEGNSPAETRTETAARRVAGGGRSGR
jgi:cell division protein FtsW